MSPLSLLSSDNHATNFQVTRIICIGRNYPDHAIEMGHDPDKEPPFFFFKPLSALNTSHEFPLPSYSSNVHHELELVLALNKGGKNLSEQQAKSSICGVGLGLDMTCRDIQQEAKKAGRPWELAKGFDLSAPCSTLSACDEQSLSSIGDMQLTKNGNQVQTGNWRSMIWSPSELIQYISQYLAIQTGDLIYTGTPSGVGPVQVGDRLEASASGLSQKLSITVTK